ncbi:MAG: hypothetical protein J5797_07805 [Prevotella sp.]|nr:hypothetical protein [Prevotella sp.]
MKRLLLSISFFISYFSFSVAQTPAATKEINAIKRDTTCIYAEATMKDVNEAIIGAKSILEVKVGDWIRSRHPNEGIEVCIAKAKEHSFEVQTRRGDYYRAFVYVRKGDILPVSDKSEVVVFQVQPDSIKPLTTPEEVISEETPVETSAPAVTLTTEEEKMVVIASFYDIEPYIKGMRDKNKLEAYGKYATLPADSACHLFVYDQQGQVKAVLRKTSDAQINLKTLKEDNVKNYRNCGAIWFRLKK